MIYLLQAPTSYISVGHFRQRRHSFALDVLQDFTSDRKSLLSILGTMVVGVGNGSKWR